MEGVDESDEATPSRTRFPLSVVGLEMQMAIDELFAGSADGLRALEAQNRGVEPGTLEKIEFVDCAVPLDDLGQVPFFKFDDLDPPDEQGKDRLPPALERLSDTGKHIPLRLVSTPFAPDFQHSGKDEGRLSSPGSQDETSQTLAIEGSPSTDIQILPSAPSTSFAYDSLRPQHEELRLLKLGPQENGAIHQLQMQTFKLSEAPDFFCLSYVWGVPDRIVPMNVNGHRVLVTANLFSVLNTSFERYQDAWLWADGICINQDDIKERAQQVLIMGKIYKQALMVLAHPLNYSVRKRDLDEKQPPNTRVDEMATQSSTSNLSEILSVLDNTSSRTNSDDTATSSSAEAPVETTNFNEIRRVRKAISLMTYISRIWSETPDYTVMSDLEWDEWELPADDDLQTWFTVLSFWSEAWFFRAWVLQEIVLAKKVVVLYYTATISLDAVNEFWDGVGKHGLPRPLRIGGFIADRCARARHLSCVSAVKKLRDDRAREDSMPEGGDSGGDMRPLGLLELLCLSRNNLATDARDKVYSLLGMTDDPIAQSLIPDYSDGNSAREVYLDVAQLIIGSDRGAEVLHHAGVDRQTPNLPSWAPDWAFQSRSTLPTHLYQCTGINTRPRASVSVDSASNKPTLQLRGVILAPVTWLGMAWRYYSHDTSQLPFALTMPDGEPDTDVARTNDEDSRAVILTVGLMYGAREGCPARYACEGWGHALARTLAVDQSWRGARIRVAASSPAARIQGKDSDSGKVFNATSLTSWGFFVEFFDAFAAFREYYSRPGGSAKPGLRDHKTDFTGMAWLLDCDEEEEAELQKIMVPFTAAMDAAQRGRRLAIIGDKGDEDDGRPDGRFVASVPWDTQMQDMVMILEGFSTPFVVRSCERDAEDGSEDRYELVGDCYVHGIMDGELMRANGDETVKIEQDSIPGHKSSSGKHFMVQTPDGLKEFAEVTLV